MVILLTCGRARDEVFAENPTTGGAAPGSYSSPLTNHTAPGRVYKANKSGPLKPASDIMDRLCLPIVIRFTNKMGWQSWHHNDAYADRMNDTIE